MTREAKTVAPQGASRRRAARRGTPGPCKHDVDPWQPAISCSAQQVSSRGAAEGLQLFKVPSVHGDHAVGFVYRQGL